MIPCSEVRAWRARSHLVLVAVALHRLLDLGEQRADGIRFVVRWQKDQDHQPRSSGREFFDHTNHLFTRAAAPEGVLVRGGWARVNEDLLVSALAQLARDRGRLDELGSGADHGEHFHTDPPVMKGFVPSVHPTAPATTPLPASRYTRESAH